MADVKEVRLDDVDGGEDDVEASVEDLSERVLLQEGAYPET